MKVQLTTDRASLLGPAQRDGDVIEVTQSEGEALIRTRQAVPVECATVPPAETMNRKHKPTRR